MRFFDLLNFQHTMAWLFPTLFFMVVFGVGLAYSHLRSEDSEDRKQAIYGRYPDDLRTRNAPFPLVMMLIIAGTFIWGFLYIVMHGILGVKI